MLQTHLLFIPLICLRYREPWERGSWKSVRARVEKPREKGPLNELDKAHVSSETEAARTRPAWVCPRSSAYTSQLLLAWWFCGTPKSGSWCFSESLAGTWHSFPLIGLPRPALIGGFCLVWWHLALSCWVLCLGGLSFLEDEMEGVWLWGRGNVKSTGRGNCGSDVLYERIKYSQ